MNRKNSPFAVVVLHRNREPLLRICLSSIRSHFPDVPVIVADNRSRCKPDLLTFRARLIRSKRNIGNILRFRLLDFIDADWIFMIDEDCVVTECSRSILLRHIEQNNLVRFKIVDTTGEQVFGNVSSGSFIRNIPFCACLLHKEAFSMLECFCLFPFFGALEVIGAMLWPKLEWNIVYEPRIVITHMTESRHTYSRKKIYGRTVEWLEFFTLFFPINMLPIMLTRVFIRMLGGAILRKGNPVPVLCGTAKFVFSLKRILKLRCPFLEDSITRLWAPDPEYDMFSVPLRTKIFESIKKIL